MAGWLHCLLTNCPELAIQNLTDWVLYQTQVCCDEEGGGGSDSSRRRGAARKTVTSASPSTACGGADVDDAGRSGDTAATVVSIVDNPSSSSSGGGGGSGSGGGGCHNRRSFSSKQGPAFVAPVPVLAVGNDGGKATDSRTESSYFSDGGGGGVRGTVSDAAAGEVEEITANHRQQAVEGARASQASSGRASGQACGQAPGQAPAEEGESHSDGKTVAARMLVERLGAARREGSRGDKQQEEEQGEEEEPLHALKGVGAGGGGLDGDLRIDSPSSAAAIVATTSSGGDLSPLSLGLAPPSVANPASPPHFLLKPGDVS